MELYPRKAILHDLAIPMMYRHWDMPQGTFFTIKRQRRQKQRARITGGAAAPAAKGSPGVDGAAAADRGTGPPGGRTGRVRESAGE